MRSLVVLLLTFACSGCTKQQLYEQVQHNLEWECNRLPQDAFEECMAGGDMPYKEYEAARRAMLEEKN